MDLRFAEIRNLGQLCNIENKGNKKENIPLNVVIPYYQRPYKWDSTRIGNLITDFHNNEEGEDEEGEGYFAGSVVMVEGRNGEFEVVDGQQRITTLFLTNYLRFVLVRSYIELMINMKRISKIPILMNELIDTAVNIFDRDKVEQLKNVKEGVDNFISTVEEQSADDIEKAWDDMLEYYQSNMWLPKKNFSNMDIYKKEYFNLNRKLLSNVSLALRYSRNGYNEKLKEALSRIMIIMPESSNPCFETLSFDKNSEAKNPVTEQYINAAKYIYDGIVDSYISGQEKPIEYIKATDSAMKKILNNINFCVVVTGKEKDAYTLFEVLNDRNFPVEDLELIKNLFYKWYCKHNEDDAGADYYIEKADKKWVEEIFPISTKGKERSKLISYLAAQYFTADSRLKYNDNEKYREVIEKEYLNKKNVYEGEDLLNDIRIYEMLGIMLDEFDFRYQKKAENVIKAERESAKSITYKALNLLNALTLYGVIPAITNVIIKKFLDKHPFDECSGDAQIMKFREFVQGIIKDSANNNAEYIDIHNVSYNFWRYALLAQNSDRVRGIAKDYILKNNSFSTDYVLKVDSQDIDMLNEEFRRWINAWKYGNEKSQLKVKVLFINLFYTNRVENKLIFNKTGTKFPTDNIQLDHLEPDKINSTAMEKYFEPSSKNAREDYTDSLGNFMIMDADSNVDKSTLPLQDALKIYDKMGEHWLIREIHDVFEEDSCGTNRNIDNKIYRVPNEEFFNRRKQRLITYFKAILNKRLGDDSVEIPDI